ncbi:MAG: (2Fe-2S)-binding protein [Acidobacteriota bacterium]
MTRPSVLPVDVQEASPRPDENCSAATPDAANLCPASQTIGSKVDLVTVKALVNGDALRRLDGKTYRFCPAPGCDVVYFDTAANSIFRKKDLTVRIGQKETQDPITVCYCFDFTVADLRRDMTVGGKTEIPAIIAAEIKAGHCACEVKNPQGSCCLGNVTAAVRSLSRKN